MSALVSRGVVLLAVFLLNGGSCVLGEFYINLLYRGQSDANLTNYMDELFANHYANIPLRRIKGHIMQPEPPDACQYVPLLPENHSSWFALVEGYPSCAVEMVNNVRNAGYKLIIAFSYNDTNRSVSQEVKNMQFPVAIVTEEYANYLKENALSNSSTDPITASVYRNIFLSVIVISLPILLVLCCVCLCCLGFCICACRREPDVDHQIHDIEERRRTFEQLHRQERLARQELIESILRQLQELQVDLGAQVPLGAAATKRLPKRKYHVGKEVCDACAICVEDFQEGSDVRVLPCDHVFHPKCVDEWLSNHSSLCPLCKLNVSRNPNEGAAVNIPPPPPPVLSSSDEDTPFPATSGSESRLLPIDRSRNNLQSRYGSV